MSSNADLFKLVRAHPWHGLDIGASAPREVPAYIESVPGEAVRYELDTVSGHLKVEDPRLAPNVSTLYGLIPQTCFGEQVARLRMQRTGQRGVVGDGGPLRIGVLAENDFDHGDFIVQARPIGGVRSVEDGRAGDRIVAVLKHDATYEDVRDLKECPTAVLSRLVRGFSGTDYSEEGSGQAMAFDEVFGTTEALEVIQRGREDYGAEYSELARLLVQLR